jgi:hypothetical protein
MANTKFSELTLLTAAASAATDFIVINDVGEIAASQNKRMVVSELAIMILNQFETTPVIKDALMYTGSTWDSRPIVVADVSDLSTWVGTSNITTLGTIATGVWTGTAINQTYLTGQSGTNTGDETLSSINTLAITTVGTIDTGTWQGTAINQTYLTGQSGTNTGDQTSLTGISDTKANFSTAVSDGTILFSGDVTSNVSTALSTGTRAATTYGITSDGGADDIILLEATTSLAGLLGSAKWDEIVANTAKTGFTNLTGDVTSSGAATTIAAGAVDLAMLSATGTPTGSNFLRGDNTWAAPSGSGDMVLADAQTNAGIKTFEDTTMKLRNVADTFDGYFVNTNTADRVYTLQDAAGTIAFTSDITGTNSNTNTGDQTTIVGITGTKAQFDTAITDGNAMYIGDAPTSHTHVEADITDLGTYLTSVGHGDLDAEFTTINTTFTGALDWSSYMGVDETLTGNLTITDTSLRTGTKFFKLTGDFTLTLPSYYDVMSGTYDGTKDNLLQATCLDATGAAEIVLVSIISW